MNIAVVSYSHTGNNGALAAAVAKELSAVHIKISEEKPRKMSTILLDMLFNRMPKVKPFPSELGKYEGILFIAPVWMGKASAPLRAYFKHLKTHPQPYAFASISGGALNPNPKLAEDIESRVGARPRALVDLHIADLMPQEPKPKMKDTSAYRLNDAEVLKLAGVIAASVKTQMGL